MLRSIKSVSRAGHLVIAGLIITALLVIVVALQFDGMAGGGLIEFAAKSLEINGTTSLLWVGIASIVAVVYVITRPRSIYLVDFACYRPEDNRKCSIDHLEHFARQSGVYNDVSLSFQKKVLMRSGLGDETYVPSFVFDQEQSTEPGMKHARLEVEEVMFGALDELFRKTNVSPTEIEILIVNCSVFNPTPSHSAMVVNRYKMKETIRSYNLGGMGCSAGLIAIDLAKDLLKVHGSSYAVVVSMENITLNWYCGNNRSMLVTNCLFRVGGAAILLSNKGTDARRAKYKLLHTVRTHKGSDDKAFQSVIQEEDDQGLVGVSLSKHLMEVAGEALKTNIVTLGPLVLPISEQLRFVLAIIKSKLLKNHKKPRVPDFTLAFEHFCIHAGGRAVLDELEKNLRLSAWHMEPARMTLHRFGNTSSSSLWYELAYSEAKNRIKQGDRVWQIAFGSGFKCNSAVWKSLRTIAHPSTNAWLDCVDRYPVEPVEGGSTIAASVVRPELPLKS
ncbi:hypothetical protein O6H91_16G028600 [Diphasiastrum complanatum]|uniref:Uncharacterized protein n=1 Tax=Diphasiastrum complanatum TaxID=34168 RepID=A0ACC2BB15_DIPCM|nr:hypothetical protein O6H91_Y452700 [Diphasiastrum complanatum]KAJ7526953.1 hypothetical protein O6H91_16G028600 [Diphasiastrum complanatum]